ncbi:MAG TPA: PilZ domain-containing protein [Phycisphaerae bacterium]|nr:PilZ domain-containing protein [Phycisphaerae bacterium]
MTQVDHIANMPSLHNTAKLSTVSAAEVPDILAEALKRHGPMVVTVRYKNRWVVFAVRVVGIRAGTLWMTLPGAVGSIAPEEMLRRQTIGMSFRLENFRYFFCARVAQFQPYTARGGLKATAAGVRCPKEMQRLSRRIHPRVDVPGDLQARVTIWPGGRRTRFDENVPDRPVWSGQLTNLSTGGFQARTEGSTLAFFEPGDLVGARLAFEPGQRPIDMDAQFRYGSTDGSMSLLGFQFIGLDERDDGEEILEELRRRVELYLQG